MTSSALRAGEITEARIRQKLTEGRGDLFLASCMLGCTPRELDRYIRASDELQGFAAAISTVKKNADYDKMSAEAFANELAVLTRSYRLDALNTIHELSQIDIAQETEDGRTVRSAALAEVKLKAAVQLRGSGTDTNNKSDSEQILAELNHLYQQAAPRIKSIRAAVQIEYSDGEKEITSQ